MKNPYDEYKVDVPAGRSGDWEIKSFEISEQASQSDRLRSAINGSRRYVPPGHYMGLYRGGAVIMSDTPDEIRDHLMAIRYAHGHCLVNGLGLGMVAAAMLAKPEVTRVTAIELSSDVIHLVAPHLSAKFGGRLIVVEADAFDYEPPKGIHYGCVWHDVWDSICADNLESMKKLHRKYGRRAEWQGSWCRAECECQRRQDRQADMHCRLLRSCLGGNLQAEFAGQG